MPTTLIENELSGHEKRAFSGADTRSTGRCEPAHGGALFIDEVGELALPLQAELLRFLQGREFERVDGSRTQTADARAVAATHRELEETVGRDEFRGHLYDRIKVVEIVLPPLRDRGVGDVARLARHFLAMYRKKHDKRELQRDAEARRVSLAGQHPRARALHRERRGAVRGDCHRGRVALAPPRAPSDLAGSVFVARPLADVEPKHIVAMVRSVDGNRSEAARSLGIGRNTLL